MKRITIEAIKLLKMNEPLIKPEAKCISGKHEGSTMFINHFNEVIVNADNYSFVLEYNDELDGDSVWEVELQDISPYEITLDFIKKVMYNTSFRDVLELQYNESDKSKFVMFRSRGHEEEYTINAENNGWIKMYDGVNCFADKYDNYTIVICAYQDAEFALGDSDNPMYSASEPYDRQKCSLCGDGGCPSCQPSWFI